MCDFGQVNLILWVSVFCKWDNPAFKEVVNEDSWMRHVMGMERHGTVLWFLCLGPSYVVGGLGRFLE